MFCCDFVWFQFYSEVGIGRGKNHSRHKITGTEKNKLKITLLVMTRVELRRCLCWSSIHHWLK